MHKSNRPLTDNMGQIYHQTVHTEQGQVIDLDEQNIDVIDSTGLAVLTEDEQRIAEIKKSITLEKLIETFNDNAHETLQNLLALQDNQHPFKKGGIGIAYRTDVLIMHCKMNFTSDENIVFDAILGTMSSRPEDKVYRIEPANFLKFSKHSKPDYIYTIFNRGAKKLKERHLVFENLGPDGEDELVVPWFTALRYHNRKKSDASAYIEFAPSEFFKDLALCSGLVHGAFGSLEVTMQLDSKYSIALYWFFENMKNYRQYKDATQGMFRMSIEKLKEQFSIPESYSHNDIVRRVLEPAKKDINSVEECDFTFDYEPQKVSGKFAGYLFTIKSKQYIDVNENKAIEQNIKDSFYEEIKTLLNVFRIELIDDDIYKIYSLTKQLGKDSMFLTPIFMEFRKVLDDKNRTIKQKGTYLLRMIENADKFKPGKTMKSFERNDSYADIENDLLAN